MGSRGVAAMVPWVRRPLLVGLVVALVLSLAGAVLTGTLGFPAPLAVLALVTEITAPMALLLGVGGRVAALGVVGLMAGAISTHVGNGFFMNWFGSLPAGQEGFEYHLLVIALAATVILPARLRTVRTGVGRTGVVLTAAVPCRGGRSRDLDISVLL